MTEFRLSLNAWSTVDVSNVQIKSPSLLRLHKDLLEIHPLPPGVILEYPVFGQDDHCIKLTITPQEGFYKDKTYQFMVRLKSTYPLDPPKVQCLNPIFHPNIDPESGAVCLNILRLDWSPVLSLSAVLFGLILLLDDPQPDEPLNKDAAKLLAEDVAQFKRIVSKT